MVTASAEQILGICSAGDSLGRRMRRGTITVQGPVGDLCGWEMLAGTILVLGAVGKHPGLDMKRGTIILASAIENSFRGRTTFAKGIVSQSQTVAMIGAWLKQSGFKINIEDIDQRLIKAKFSQWHGDLNEGARGEIFVAADL